VLPENDEPIMTSPNTVDGTVVYFVAPPSTTAEIPKAPSLEVALATREAEGAALGWTVAQKALHDGEPFEMVFAGPLLVVITGGSLSRTMPEVCSTPENSRAPSLQGGVAATRPSPKAGGGYVSPHLKEVHAAMLSATAEPTEIIGAQPSPQAGGAKAASPQAGGTKAASPHAAVAKPSPLAGGAKPFLLTEVKKAV